MLTEQQGLNTADIKSIAKDRNGFLWLASESAIQRYDGKQAKIFEFNESVVKVFVDNKDRKWVITKKGVLLFKNDHAGFIRVSHSTDKNKSIICLFNDSINLYLLLSNGLQLYDETLKRFKLTDDLKNKITKPISAAYDKSGNYLFLSSSDRIYSYDLLTRTITAIPFKNTFSIVPLDCNELIVSDWKSKSYHINFYRNQVTEIKPKEAIPFSSDNFLRIFAGVMLKENTFLLSSNSGFLVYDRNTQKFESPVIYNRGQPLDNNSSVKTMYRDNRGIIYMNHADGVAFFTPRTESIHFLKDYKWKDIRLPAIDVRSFAEDDEGNIWMATLNGLTKLNMKNGALNNFNASASSNSFNFPSVRYVLFHQKKLWIGTSGKGIWLFDPVTQRFTRPHFKKDSIGRKTERQMNEEFVWKMATLKNGDVFIAGGARSYIVNHKKLLAQQIKSNYLLAASRSVIVDSSGRIWHGTAKGLNGYDSSFNLIVRLRDSMPDKRVGSIYEWKKDHFLVGSKGLFEIVITKNKVTGFKKIEAMPSVRFIFCMEKDYYGNVWLGTDEGLYRYDPLSNEAILFNSFDNIQPQAFNSNAMFITRTGLLFAGGRGGINYFHPGKIFKAPLMLDPVVSSFSIGSDDSSFFSDKSPFRVNFFNRDLIFNISAPEYTRPFKMQYRYRLTGKNDWISNGNNNIIRMNNLSSGKYSFTAAVSLDGKNWFETKNPVRFIILKPWWHQWWFRIACVILLAVLSVAVINYRLAKRKQKEFQRTIEYFSNSKHEHSSVDDLLWDITWNCISRLGFEDCVIYLVDEERQILVQKAAYGSKSPQTFEIINPIEIPVGKGIVGHVAQTGKAEIVGNTRHDNRYIIDDEIRNSEITVPIIHQEKVIGIIDSEHKQRNFFTKKHLELLQTIASISSAKISKGIVLEKMKQTEKELAALNTRMLETQFLNLRLQMNPHFLFNSLSSIQHLIVSNQTHEAYKYLTVFSHFLRSVLKYADKTFISLQEEIQMLEMYIKLESLGFDKSFNYDITIDEKLDTEDILIPPLMIQPLIENAIWHGLVNKEGDKYFSLQFHNDGDDNLVCLVEDNGIGRKKAAAINLQSLQSSIHESKATKLLKQRLELLRQKTSKEASIYFEDIYEHNLPAGTRVQVIIPYYNTIEI